MDIFLRAVAIAIEVILLAGIFYCLFKGVWLTIFDLGLKSKYNKVIKVVFLVVGCLIAAFFIAHLTMLYPTILPR